MSVEPTTNAGGTVNNPITALYGPRYITPGDAEWPTQLDQLEPPVTGLWVTGTSNLRDALTKAICVSGARAAGSAGEETGTQLGSELASMGWTVVTGGSFGIEAAATRGALGHRTPVVIVAPCGLNQMHPSAHGALFAGALAAGGLMVSEHHPDDIRPNRNGLRRRNQLLGMLARGVVVVEAAARSGSTQVVAAAETARLPVFAVPGPINSPLTATPHQLIREGRATLITTAAQIVESYDSIVEDPMDEFTHRDREINLAHDTWPLHRLGPHRWSVSTEGVDPSEWDDFNSHGLFDIVAPLWVWKALNWTVVFPETNGAGQW